MKEVIVDDRLLRRGRRAKLLLVTPGGVVEFTGQDIAPALRVVRRAYTKDGKWSHTTFHLAVREDCEVLGFPQDWGTGEYLPCSTWSSAEALLREKTGAVGAALPQAAVIAAIRAIFPAKAAALDAGDAAYNAAGDALQRMLDAQHALAAAQAAEAALAAAEAIEAQATAVAARVAAATQALKERGGKGISLSALQRGEG